MSRVFIEFSVGENSDRLEIQLFDHRCPKAVANFLYLLSAHEIPDEVISAREKAIRDALPGPLKATRFSRIDAKKQIDFGVSGTASVFGGCYDDEAVGPTQEQQQENSRRQQQPPHPNFLHDFGTISVANCGPNTNGSRYFISMGRRPEVDGYHQIIGVVAPHSKQALMNLASVKVNVKKGFAPEPAVKISDCGIIRSSDTWKQIALSTEIGSSNNNNDNNNQQQQQQQAPTTISRLKMLKGRGSQLEKRMPQGDAESLLNAEQTGNFGNNNNNNNKTTSTFENLDATIEAAEIARRRAKKRRIEDAAAGSGAWVEPPEVSSGSATRGGVSDSFNNNNNNSSSSGNNNNNPSEVVYSDGTRISTTNTGPSFSQAYQATGGNMSEAERLVGENKSKGMSERTMFAVAARTNQFMQDVNLLSAQQKSTKGFNNSNKKHKKKSLKY